MKLFIVLAAVSLACFGTIPAFAQETSDPVTIEKDRILIPGAKITEKDQRDLNAILAQYDKSLYKIKGYVKGKASKPQGTLKDASIDKVTARRAAVHAKDPNFSGWTLQIGATSNQDITRKPGNTSNQNKPGNTSNQNKPGSTANQDKPGNTSNQNKPGLTSNQDVSPTPGPQDPSKARELVKRLTPILRKYTKTQNAR